MSTTPLPPFDEATLALLSDHLDGRLDAAAEAALRQRLARSGRRLAKHFRWAPSP